MNENSEILQTQLEKYEAQLKCFKSYIRELNDRTAEHGTEREHFETDLLEAEHNVKYYEAEIALVREQINKGSHGATYFVYEDAAGEWRWQLRAGNNRIIADSGEGYRNKEDCLHGIALVKDSKDAPVRDRS